MVQVRAEILEERIAVKSDRRFPGDYDMSKSVPGGRWNKEGRHWNYPLNWTTCTILRSVYSDMLVLGPLLTAWGRAEKARLASVRSLGASYDAELQRIPKHAPVLDAAMAVRTYQRVGARFIAENRKVLLADEPTLGKTIQILGGLVEAGLEEGLHLIVAPKSSLKSTWADEVFKWTDFHPFWMPDGRAKRERMIELFLEDEHPSKFLIINPEMLQVKITQWCKKCGQWEPTKAEAQEISLRGGMPWPMVHSTDGHKTNPEIQKQDWPNLFDIEWTSIIIDEAHKSLLGNRGGTKRTQTAEGFVRLKVREDGLKVASTGTPLKGKALNFWSTFNWLDPKAYSSKWAFAESFLEVEEGVFGKSIGDIRADREDALYDSLRGIMLRRTKREVQPDLPEDMYIDHWVEMTDRHRKQYLELVTDGETEISGGAISTQGILAEYTRQKQFAFGSWKNVGGKLQPDPAHSPKMDELLELLRERGVTGNPDDDFRLDGGWKYIIGSQFTAILDFLERELEKHKIPVIKITGAVTSKKRESAVSQFQNDDGPDAIRVLLVNTLAGGTALTLDAKCDEMFILDETWVHDDQFQLEGRIRNRDVEKRVAVRSYHYIRTRETIEEEIAQSGLTQDEFQKTLLDRSRGMKIKKRELNAS